jgi:arylsulfatase A-like enzyme
MGLAIGSPDRPARMRSGSILAWAVWLGLIAGTLELAIFWLKCQILDPRNMNVSRHLVWMFPVAGLVVVGVPGVVLAVLSRFWARAGRPAYVLFALLFLAFVGLIFRAPVYTSVSMLLAAGLAWRMAAFLARREPWLDGWVRRGVLIPLGLLALTVSVSFGREAWLEGRGRPTASTSGSGRGSKNVILIVMDTVRAESLGLYGYPRDTTPQLAKLASRGVLFDRAFSTAPWTAPSHASLFTGRWPHELTIGWDRPLDGTYPTLAEVLQSRGYATAGFVANTTYCSYETGLARGFGHYEDYDVTLRGVFLCSSVVERTLNFFHKHPGLARVLGDDGSSSGDRKNASRINGDFLGWLDRRSPDRPFFAFLNFYDAHHPYLSPEPENGPEFGRKAESARDYRLLKTWWERDKQGIKAEDLALARDSYDRCIAYLDDQLGRLFDELGRRGILEDSIVIVTADHGEHLGERDLFGHGCSVYRPELHVPLIVVAPRFLPEKRVISDPVSLRDVPATVLDLLGLDAKSVFPGRSLVGISQGEVSSSVVRSEVECPPEDDPNRGRSPAARGAMTSIVSRDFHYIRGGDGREELYDLNLDPAEIRDLSSRPELAGALGQFREQVRK